MSNTDIEDFMQDSIDDNTTINTDIDTNKTGEDVVSIIKDIPMGLLIVMFIILCICAIVGLAAPAFGNPSFLVNQMVLNFTLIIILSFFYGIICIILRMK